MSLGWGSEMNKKVASRQMYCSGRDVRKREQEMSGWFESIELNLPPDTLGDQYQ